MKGGTFNLTMGALPATNRGTGINAYPYSFSTDAANEKYLK
jgi:putative alpha-1,2-mannosidase